MVPKRGSGFQQMLLHSDYVGSYLRWYSQLLSIKSAREHPTKIRPRAVVTVKECDDPIALDTAKQAAKTYLPKLIDSVSQKVLSKFRFQTESSGSSRQPSKKPSLLDNLNGKNTTIKVGHAQDTDFAPARVDITHSILARERTWIPSDEWQKSWVITMMAPS
ncbi:hypothetical protein F66182_10170 [Fusarium sp. NRRL 66182]|nr:hypothetical protein F66182_10170 [Fusarium sp. NRRL 66182]